MKLRVRLQRETSRVDLPGEEPSLTDLRGLIQEVLLPSHGLSADTEFSLSLNGSELLTESEQTLSSCGIVSGDLICVILPQLAAASSTSKTSPTSSDSTRPNTETHSTGTQSKNRQSESTSLCDDQPSSSSSLLPAASSSSAPSSYSWEPMLCSEAEEGQAPLSLEVLYLSAGVTSPDDAIMAAGHLLMLETGFIPQDSGLKSGEMPAGWRSAGGLYKLHYTHPLCEDTLVSVLAVRMGPVLAINAILKVNQTVHTVPKLTLKPCSYVSDQWPGESAAAAFKKLKKLSRLFKDQLAYPLIATARAAMSLPVAFGLVALPAELVLRVFRLLDVASVLRLSSVCRQLNVVGADSMLWRHLYRRDFTDPDPSRPRDTNWRELYKTSYRKRHAGRVHSYPMPFRPGVLLPPPLPISPPLPGIIGGDYDQRPVLPRDLFPRPRFNPIAPQRDPDRRAQNQRPWGGRPADVRRGFI
ncbi:F-box only protein 7 [Halichoeres trimaculatus]|uniref:F-box only protein 7 n=1 Tax=Halichoeres trimaculatus TaxID=147232 RepID=UPI003D9EC4BE